MNLPEISIPNCHVLSDQLTTGGQPSEAQLSAATAAGFQLVINLAMHDDTYSLPDERRTVAALGMAYEHIPVIWQRPALADLEAFFAAMERHAGRRVLVHCAANKRVSAFVFLYRVLRLGWRPEDALPDLHALWQPNEVWQAFIDRALRDGDHSQGRSGEPHSGQ